MEFASGLYDGELRGFVRQLTRLQDALGSMQDAEVASARLQAIALTEEGASLSRAAVFAMGGVAGQYRSEAEHLLSGMPKLLRLLEGKEWKRARSLLELRQQAAAPPLLPPTAATTAAAADRSHRVAPCLLKGGRPTLLAPHAGRSSPLLPMTEAAEAPGVSSGGGGGRPTSGRRGGPGGDRRLWRERVDGERATAGRQVVPG